ncbi:Transcription termination factor like [Quillaja saponaria]|uniref:Transcription termination factor like n=1 Tax=Quillaja saponaria TaxID=32244 RepID=A0AAD7VNI3_QUISA|nr:Transcription termination factor like [Quillaja saponaria]
MIRLLSITSAPFFPFPRIPVYKALQIFTSATYSTVSPAQVEKVEEEVIEQSEDSTGVLRRWGCSDTDISMLFFRRPSLRNANLSQLQSKLCLLSDLGITGPDLVKIINCRPRFLSCRINHCFEERLVYFMSLFESKEVLRRAIVRNPSLLTYDLHNAVKPAIKLYEELGVTKRDLIPMLLSRPTMIPRTSFNDEKLEYICRAGLSQDSKMYKYVVTLIGISCVETIRGKLANFEKFGLTNEEIFSLFARSPLILTLSIDKVQRNMTFVMGTMKLSAKVVLKHPFLLYMNLDTALKPRILLAEKIQDMNLKLQIKGPTTLRALRMTEKRFVKQFIKRHPKEVADQLMEFYRSAKEIKRLAESSKKTIHKGFPF